MSDPGKTTSPTLAACCGALIGFALGYVLPTFARLPNLVYGPLERRFALGTSAGTITMGYYGFLLFGLAGALLVGGLALLVARARRRAPSPASGVLPTAWALVALLLVGAYFTWVNWP